MKVWLCDAAGAPADMMVPTAEGLLLIANNDWIRLKSSLGSGGRYGRMVTSAGVLGLFLLGISHLTEGLKVLAGGFAAPRAAEPSRQGFERGCLRRPLHDSASIVDRNDADRDRSARDWSLSGKPLGSSSG